MLNCVNVEEAVDVVKYKTRKIVFVLWAASCAASPSDLEEGSLTQNCIYNTEITVACINQDRIYLRGNIKAHNSWALVSSPGKTFTYIRSVLLEPNSTAKSKDSPFSY